MDKKNNTFTVVFKKVRKKLGSGSLDTLVETNVSVDKKKTLGLLWFRERG